MADDKSTQAIIIKKIKKSGHASHGGAWKIAYADFVTAMMAFFLLLWLLSSVSQEQLEGISNYFAPVSVSATKSGSGDILGGATITVEGSAQTSTSRDAVTVDLPPPKAGTGGEGLGGEEEATPPPSPEEVEEERLRQQEEEQFDEAKEELEKAIESVPQLKELAESLLIDNTPEGLRIQLLDKDGLSMFPSGSAKMFEHTRRILELVSSVIVKMPQRLSISGHTDSVPFSTGNGYGNWELSADRANSARRELVGFKVPEERVSRVVGKAATDPFLVDDPKNAQNRRLSIILLRGTGREKPDDKEPAKKKVKLKVRESLPGLSAIRQRQEKEGLKALEKPEIKPKKTKKKIVAKPKPKGIELDLGAEQKAPALPGLEAIRKRQIKKGLKKSEKVPAQTGGTKGEAVQPQLETLKPLITKREKIETTEGETLPGLSAIRKRQLEKEKAAPK